MLQAALLLAGAMVIMLIFTLPTVIHNIKAARRARHGESK